MGYTLRQSRLFQLSYLTVEDEQMAWTIFKQYDDKKWSYTDCACLVLIRRLGLNEVVAFDHHFRQMGLVVYPQ